MNRALRCLIAGAMTATCCFASGQPRYSVQEVLVNGKVAEAYGLGNDGYVVGVVDSGTRSLGFKWRNGSAELLDAPYKATRANAINSFGEVVGGAGNNDGTGTAALWDKDGFHGLGDLGGGSANANSINEGGWVVGGSYIDRRTDEFHPFLYRNGAMEDLGMLGIPENNDSEALRINSQNVVVGFERDDEFAYYTPWIWTDGGGLRRLFPDIYQGGGVPTDLNDLGEVTVERAIWKDGKLRPLPDAFGLSGINNYGDVVGDLTNHRGPGVWFDNVPFELQALLDDGSYRLEYALDINDSGQILARANRSGSTYYVLLNPVPEPGTLVAIGLGFAMLCRKRR